MFERLIDLFCRHIRLCQLCITYPRGAEIGKCWLLEGDFLSEGLSGGFRGEKKKRGCAVLRGEWVQDNLKKKVRCEIFHGL